MSGCLPDTNVLIYAASPSPDEAGKQNAAQRLLEAGDSALSVQMLQEFYHQATRATRREAIRTFFDSWQREALSLCHGSSATAWSVTCSVSTRSPRP